MVGYVLVLNLIKLFLEYTEGLSSPLYPHGHPILQNLTKSGIAKAKQER